MEDLIGESTPEVSKKETLNNENSTFLYFCENYNDCQAKNERKTIVSALYETSISLSINSTHVVLDNSSECFPQTVSVDVNIESMTDYISDVAKNYGLDSANKEENVPFTHKVEKSGENSQKI